MNRFDYYAYRYGYPVIKQPPPLILTTVETAPIKYEPEPPKQFISRMLGLYRRKGYPLGKTRRGFKKWLKRMILKAVGCKSIRAAKRKYKI
ncbi:MAG: hypothetical protein JSS81_07285 [Acidobacteria bacterium]|nr:hypothetical protein [Acidobacteriota bacterium]